ncbi:unnamed protein product [Durusdinium trenchii]|uniref:Uncharacterized protein n=1 Tax=Durusdinium trenchii TaxID=1381693 RepID=A0ABP0J3S9_9DINO
MAAKQASPLRLAFEPQMALAPEAAGGVEDRKICRLILQARQPLAQEERSDFSRGGIFVADPRSLEADRQVSPTKLSRTVLGEWMRFAAPELRQATRAAAKSGAEAFHQSWREIAGICLRRPEEGAFGWSSTSAGCTQVLGEEGGAQAWPGAGRASWSNRDRCTCGRFGIDRQPFLRGEDEQIPRRSRFGCFGPQYRLGGPSPPGSGANQPLTMVAPSTAFSGEAGRYAWYRVSFMGGVDLRHGPSVEAPRTGETLCQNATFAAAEELMGADGRIYLRLADGRGWAFDDSTLFPCPGSSGSRERGNVGCRTCWKNWDGIGWDGFTHSSSNLVLDSQPVVHERPRFFSHVRENNRKHI